MTTTDLKNLLQRVETWPEEAQDELIAVAEQIESELQGRDYFATREELQIIDDATASIDGGEVATDLEIKAACKISFGMKLVYSRRALADLNAIATYYTASASPAIADAIGRRLDSIIGRICRAPERGERSRLPTPV
jgi:hypothetical protein